MAGSSSFPLAHEAPIDPAKEAGSWWSRIRHELLFVSFATQEAALLTPLALVIMSWSRFWPAWLVFLWFLLLMLLPFNLVRLMGLLQWDRARQRRVMVAAMVLVVFLGWRMLLYEAASPLDFGWLRQFGSNMAEGGNLVWTRDLSVFVFTILAWWRGMRLAMKPLEISNAGLRLRVGGLVIAPIVAWLGTSFLTFSVVPFILLFFVASLAAVALVRAEQIETDRTGHAATLGPTWFATVLAAGLGIGLLGGVIAAFLSGESLFEALTLFSPLWRTVQFGGTVAGLTLFELLRPLIELFAALAQVLGELLVMLFGRVAEGMQLVMPQMAEQTPLLTPEATTETITSSIDLGKIVSAALMLALIVVVAWGLSRLYRQANFAARDGRPSDPLAALEAEPSGVFDRLIRRLGFRQWRAASSIRRIYETMCRAAAGAGYPRLEVETPLEYLRTLARAWPEHQEDSRLITEAFIRVRYGELPETPAELDAIRAAWKRLESAEAQRLDQPQDAGPTLEKRL